MRSDQRTNTLPRDPQARRLRPGRVLLAGASVALVAFMPPSMALATHTKRTSKPALRLTATVAKATLTVRVTTQAKATCTLKVATKKKSMSFPKVRATAKGKVTFRWTVPSNAPSGTWNFTVRCTKSGRTHAAKTTALIVTKGDGKGSLAEPSSLHLADGVMATDGLGGKGSGPCPYPQAVDQNGKCIGFPGNPFNNYESGTDIGECTWYAAGRRPDLWGIATGNAYQWYDQARAHGVPTGTVPVVGAVAVRTARPTSGSVGHVAYVVGVTPGGQPVVDDANYNNDHVIRYAHGVPAGYFRCTSTGVRRGRAAARQVVTPAQVRAALLRRPRSRAPPHEILR